ncbi:MAG: hypothetical protein ACTTKO_07135 [Candidatus Limimorpha sp.]
MRQRFFILFLTFNCLICSTILAQETSRKTDRLYSNKIAYSLGYSRIYFYYESDSLAKFWKTNFWSHTVEYDRHLFPWLEAGGYFLYSMKDYQQCWVNMAGIGLNLKLHPIGVFYKNPTFADIYGIFRGGINYRFFSNLSESVSYSAENKWYPYFSPGVGISFLNHKRVSVFLEYSKDKCFKKTYRIGMSCWF